MMLLPSVAMMRCLPQNVAKPHIIREANIIRQSRHHFAVKFASRTLANIIQKRTFVSRQRCVFCWHGNRGIRLARRYPHSAPGKRAYRSSSGVCEPRAYGAVVQNPLSPCHRIKNDLPNGRPFFMAGE